MAFGYLPDVYEYAFVYTMVCRDGDGPLYVKIGKTRNLFSRFSQLRGACPIPALYFTVIACDTKAQQDELEKRLHARFQQRNTKGEWFKFDADSPEDREQLSLGCSGEALYVIGKESQWITVSADDLDAHAAQRRGEAIKTGRKRGGEKHRRARMSAWRELSDY